MGDFRDEKRTGLGVFVHGDGVRCEGRFWDGRYHGKGILLVAGEKYKGDFRQGKKNGFGKFDFPDGSSYEGEWASGEIVGKGRYKLKHEIGFSVKTIGC